MHNKKFSTLLLDEKDRLRVIYHAAKDEILPGYEDILSKQSIQFIQRLQKLFKGRQCATLLAIYGVLYGTEFENLVYNPKKDNKTRRNEK